MFLLTVPMLQESLRRLPTLSLPQALAVEVASGLLMHAIYKKYEFYPSSVLPTLSLLIVLPASASVFLMHHFSAGIAIALGYFLFYATAISSIVVYRLSPCHPLARYPGPLFAKLSQAWLVKATVSGKYHEILKRLHDKYGPYVRVGPNEVSFVDVDLILKIIGSDGMPKGPMFDGARVPGVPANIVATRSLEDHAQLRKPWSHGLSNAATRDYTPIIIRRALQFAEELEKIALVADRRGGGVDLASWMKWFSFDFMGDIAFGGAFELMKDGDVSGIFTMINSQMKAQATLQRLPWITRVVHKFPAVVLAMRRFTTFCADCIERRRARGPHGRDLFYHLMHEEAGPGAFPPLALAVENTKVAVIAGSDTTATTLSGMFYHLLANPDVMSRLREELDAAFPPGEGDPFDFTRLAELPILNAVINETLRLQPPVPTDLQRAPAVGTGFKQIGQHYIKEGNAINLPPYVYHRDPRYFSPLPDTFWPDRWLQSSAKSSPGSEKGILNTAAYFPFSFGPAGCAGKQLAFMEMRSVTALLLQRFDMRFADGYDPASWERDLENFFVLRVGVLPVLLALRKGK